MKLIEITVTYRNNSHINYIIVSDKHTQQDIENNVAEYCYDTFSLFNNYEWMEVVDKNIILREIKVRQNKLYDKQEEISLELTKLSSWEASLNNESYYKFENRVFKKIPILISKWNDGNIKGWKAEIAYNYENYKTAKYEDIEFEDLSAHFDHDIEEHPEDSYVFLLKRDAVKCAKFVNKKYLNNKGKIWFI